MRCFEDFVVEEKAVARCRTITEAEIADFAAFSCDWYPLLTDAENAKKAIFGERTAHRLLALSAAYPDSSPSTVWPSWLSTVWRSCAS